MINTIYTKKSKDNDPQTQHIGNNNNAIAAEYVIDLRDVKSVEKEVLAAAGVGEMLSANIKHSRDMDLWPALLRRCGVVNKQMIAHGLLTGEADFPLGI